MTQVLTGQHDIQDLFREVIIDDGSGQPAVLVTQTAPTPSSLVVGAFDQEFVSDVLTTPVFTNHTRTPYTEDVVSIAEVVTMLLQNYHATIFDLDYVSESVTVHRPGTVQTSPLHESVTTSELVVMGPVPSPSVNETSAITENTAVYVRGYSPALVNDASATSETTVAAILGP